MEGSDRNSLGRPKLSGLRWVGVGEGADLEGSVTQEKPGKPCITQSDHIPLFIVEETQVGVERRSEAHSDTA